MPDIKLSSVYYVEANGSESEVCKALEYNVKAATSATVCGLATRTKEQQQCSYALLLLEIISQKIIMLKIKIRDIFMNTASLFILQRL